MRLRTKISLTIIFLVVVVASYVGVSIVRQGFSAREKPSRWEEFLARNLRRLATPAEAKRLKNPQFLSPETFDAISRHWIKHCAFCHGVDGAGNTVVGRNLYPKVPDLNRQSVQTLNDGELFYIISNGVRFTGMPAWGAEDSPEEIWQLVAFMRHLPALSPEEKEQMEEYILKSAAGRAGEEQGGIPPINSGKHNH